MRKLVLPTLALLGILAAGVAVVFRNDTSTPLVASAAMELPPFPSYVEGTGIAEASTGNIAIGTPVSGIVTAIPVTWGQSVNAGEPLFVVDGREVEAQLLPAAAEVAQAQADLAKTKNLLVAAGGLELGSSISRVDLDNRRYDVTIKEAALASAEAHVKQLNLELERYTVRAPVSGRVLQINTRVGQFAQSAVIDPPLMLFGDDDQLYVRVNIDEDDAWRVRADAAAVAFVRGNPSLNTPLRFVRFEPYVVPKASLTGSSTERIDTRVLQVVYSLDHRALPVYVGQELDVYIAAPAVDGIDPPAQLKAGNPS